MSVGGLEENALYGEINYAAVVGSCETLVQRQFGSYNFISLDDSKCIKTKVAIVIIELFNVGIRIYNC